jgi:hypothetical protein
MDATVHMFVYCVGNFSPPMGARNQIGIGLSYRPASLCSLDTQFQTRFLESIPHPIAGLKFSPLQVSGCGLGRVWSHLLLLPLLLLSSLHPWLYSRNAAF